MFLCMLKFMFNVGLIEDFCIILIFCIKKCCGLLCNFSDVCFILMLVSVIKEIVFLVEI